MLDLFGQDDGMEQLGIVAFTAIPFGMRFLFGKPTYAVAEIYPSPNGWQLKTYAPRANVWKSLTDSDLLSTVRFISAPPLALVIG